MRCGCCRAIRPMRRSPWSRGRTSRWKGCSADWSGGVEMGAVVAIDALLDQRRVWKGRPAPRPASGQPTGHAGLDAALPIGGRPEGALSEILIAADGVGELRLLWPALARLTRAGERGVGATASPRDALWATEQCLRSGRCGAVLCWPLKADDRALRRLQVAAEAGRTLGFATRPLEAARNPSPAALRIAIDARPAQLRVLKCRGGLAPPQPIPLEPDMSPAAADTGGLAEVRPLVRPAG